MAHGKLILSDIICEALVNLDLSIVDKGQLLDAILKYHLAGEEEIELPQVAAIAFSFIKVDIDANQDAYNTCQANVNVCQLSKTNVSLINNKKNKDEYKSKSVNLINTTSESVNCVNLEKNYDTTTSLINSFDINNIYISKIKKDSLLHKEPKEREGFLSTDTTVDSLVKEEKVAMVKKESDIDFKKLADYYNAKVKPNGMPQVSKITQKRRSLIMAREAEHGKGSIMQVIDKATESAFLNGDNDRGWTANFDWLFNKTNFVKVLEDTYKNKSVVRQELHNQDEKDYLDGGW